MEPDPAPEKARLRKEIRRRVESLSEEERNTASIRACSLIVRQKAWEQARAVLFYAPLKLELDVWPILDLALQGGKIVCLPRYEPLHDSYHACRIRNLAGEIGLGRFGIREPISSCPGYPLNQLDLVLVPGVAFDLHGRRLGRGKGFYDRLLRAVGGMTCGVGFDEQIIERVPVEPHDSGLNCILTPTRWIQL
ncbi:MAG TPA: 5-formyltetrahydrofolate cyclo-ligase [Verrucomicrobiae bacterium]|nr:5-formyltetrahydrofolate cyclo-ligase [Verrucomicrobiae bacterium]